jgi:hypothetical protein
MLRDMFFSLAGWLMFVLGVISAGFVRGLFSRVTSGATGARTTATG